VLHAPGISLAYVGALPLLQGGVVGSTIVDWLQHSTTAAQQLSPVQILVELHDAMEQTGKSSQGIEGGVHGMEPVEGAMPACLRQQRPRRHGPSRLDRSRRSSMVHGMALHNHGRW
jgi:hypothetical protein